MKLDNLNGRGILSAVIIIYLLAELIAELIKILF